MTTVGLLRMPNRHHQGEFHSEKSAPPRAIAIGLHFSSVRLDQMPDDGQTEAQASLSPLNSLVPLPEPVKHMPQCVLVDTLARITDRPVERGIHAFRSHLNAATVGSELDRIREQVPHYLLEPIGVT